MEVSSPFQFAKIPNPKHGNPRGEAERTRNGKADGTARLMARRCEAARKWGQGEGGVERSGHEMIYDFEFQMSCRIQNPDILRAGRVGAPGGAAGKGQARLCANRIIRPGNKM